jgi:protein-disulfide isomerase
VQNRHMSEEIASKKGIQQFFVPVLVVVAIGLAFFSGSLWQKVENLQKDGSKGTTTTAQQGTTQPSVSLDTIKGLFGKDLIKFGDAKRKVLFVELADPSCPYCHVAGGANPKLAASVDTQTNRFKYVSDGGKYLPPVAEMKKLVEAGKASYVYIYYPGHGSGEMGMKALYCANEKGKFWEAHDLLLGDAGYTLMNTTVKNDKTKSQDVADFLKSAVDADFMKSCLDSGKYDARLASDQELATSLGIQGTPDFYVNATNFPGAYNYTDMKSTVDSALK